MEFSADFKLIVLITLLVEISHIFTVWSNEHEYNEEELESHTKSLTICSCPTNWFKDLTCILLLPSKNVIIWSDEPTATNLPQSENFAQWMAESRI